MPRSDIKSEQELSQPAETANEFESPYMTAVGHSTERIENNIAYLINSEIAARVGSLALPTGRLLRSNFDQYFDNRTEVPIMDRGKNGRPVLCRLLSEGD